ncbi:MAG TPA: pirin family protein [Nocardioidaceae bacterium]|jgi:redox-sensitive bicupin YhaK (pirin superfamily)|nr:pirin family protein [Nocardioidaceae bacterium]
MHVQPDPAQQVEVRRGADRFVTRAAQITAWHSFSFGPHYDPGNVGFGCLRVHNEELVAAGAGYDDHEHRDTEIVTWVLDGALRHVDSTGHRGVLQPGTVQVMSAGDGVVHAERNADPDPGGRPVRFVQMWLAAAEPDEFGEPVGAADAAGAQTPRYQQRDASAALAGGGWVLLASGLDHRGPGGPAGPADLPRLRGVPAALHAARPAPGARLAVPAAPSAHLFLARGTATLGATSPVELRPGDAVRLTGAGSARLTAGPDGAEVLVWEMHPQPRAVRP